MTKEQEQAAALNIHQRVHAIMGEVSYIQKGEKQVDGKYRFVSHDKVAEVIHAALVKHRITVVPEVTKSTVEPFESKSTYNGQVTVKTAYFATVEIGLKFINIDKPEDFFISPGWPGTGIDPQDKAVGKAVSYAVKYGLLKVFMLETGDDPDNDQVAEYPREVTRPVAKAPEGAALPAPAALFAEITACATVPGLGDIKDKYKSGLLNLKRDDAVSYEKIINALTERKMKIMSAPQTTKEFLNDDLPF